MIENVKKIISYFCFSSSIFFIIPVQASTNDVDNYNIFTSGFIALFLFFVHRSIELSREFSKANVFLNFLYIISFLSFIYIYDLSLEKAIELH